LAARQDALETLFGDRLGHLEERLGALADRVGGLERRLTALESQGAHNAGRIEHLIALVEQFVKRS
jgi:uncharacterized protein YigA (DUF484 family)